MFDTIKSVRESDELQILNSKSENKELLSILGNIVDNLN